VRRIALFAILACGLASGCVSAANKNLVATGAAVGDGDIANWDKLTDLQKKTACWKLTRAMHVLDYSFNGTALDPQWQTTIPPWAATTAPVKSGGK
jgi:hypothetical protein